MIGRLSKENLVEASSHRIELMIAWYDLVRSHLEAYRYLSVQHCNLHARATWWFNIATSMLTQPNDTPYIALDGNIWYGEDEALIGRI